MIRGLASGVFTGKVKKINFRKFCNGYNAEMQNKLLEDEMYE